MVAKSLLRTCFVLMFVLGRSPLLQPRYLNTTILILKPPPQPKV